jgi:glycosyltransferase involved in cell wall biosynthesis
MATEELMTPKFSIITLSYNQRPYLERAVESVLGQGWPELEYIVVDPGSTDGSREFLADRLAGVPGHLLFAPDRGPADGLNKGLGMATGDIVGCLNADDAYLPDAFLGVTDGFRRHPEATVLYGNGFKSRANAKLRPFRSTRFTPRRFAYGLSTVVQQATFFRRAGIAPVEFNQANHTCWDAEFLVDIALAGGQMVHVPADWGIFEIHPDSITGSGRLARQYWVDHRRIAGKVFNRQWRASDELILQLVRLLLRSRSLLRRPFEQAKPIRPLTSELA